MGQISSPLSMRYSKSMQWPTLWGDKINFNKKVKEDVFVNSVLPLLFNEAIYLNKYTNNKNITYYLNSTLSSTSHLLKSFYENKFFLLKTAFLKLDTLTPFFLTFFGKLWIIRFNSWFILVLYIYSPKGLKKSIKSHSYTAYKKNYIIWKQNSNLKLLSDIVSHKLNTFY